MFYNNWRRYHVCFAFLGANKPSELDPKLFIPLIENEIFPASVRKFFRFGVPPLQEESFKAEETELKILQEYVSTESEV